MELVEEDALPALVDDLLRIGFTVEQAIHFAEQLHVLIQEFTLAVVALVERVGGVGAAVELQIELTHPFGQLGIVFGAFFHAVQKVARELDLGVRHAGEALLQPAMGLNMFLHRTAAAVAVTEGDDDFVVQVLLLIAVPRALDIIRFEHRRVGGVRPGRFALAVTLRREKVREDLGGINAAPQEGVAGQHIVFVPADLGGDKLIHAALAQDLRQRGGIAEHVGQPEHLAVNAEFLLKKAFAEEHLTHQTFAGGEVAVRLDPHRAFHFPAAFGDELFDLFIGRGAVLFHILIQLRLRGHEFIFGILFHHGDHGGEGAHGFFAGLCQRPQPRHVNMRVTDADHVDALILAETVIEVFFQPVERLGGGFVKRLGTRHTQVDHVHRRVDARENIVILPVVLVVHLQHVGRYFQIIIQLLNGFIINEQVGHKIVAAGMKPRVGVNENVKFVAVGQIDVAVVLIQPVRHFAVDVNQKLRLAVHVRMIGHGVEIKAHRPALHRIGQDHLFIKPAVAVLGLAPQVVFADGLPGVVHCRQIVAGRLVAAGLELPVEQFSGFIDHQRFQLPQKHAELVVQKFHAQSPSICIGISVAQRE